MNEQRMQAYVELIDQLLSCANGEEVGLLQAHRELNDLGLIHVMRAVAQDLQEQEQKRAANWLQNLAMQLEKLQGLTVTPQTQLGRPLGESDRFFDEIMLFIADNHQATEATYEFLMANEANLNSDLLQILPIRIKALLAKSAARDEGQLKFVAALLASFGVMLVNFPRGQRAINVELAIAIFKEALQVLPREVVPLGWAETKHNLAVAYYARIWGDRAQNMEEAIAAYEEALQVLTREAMPSKWATTKMNLANTYCGRVRGDRAQNVEKAITAYKEVLEVRTREAMPVDWATAKMNLALAYYERILGDRAQNLEDAIVAYKEVLEVRTREAMPVDWVQTMNNLAAAYAERIRGDLAQNLEEAISAYKEVLEVSTRETMPFNWAQTMNNLAAAYTKRIRGDPAQNLEDAITSCQGALEIFRPGTLPNDCRRTARLLGNLYADNHRWTEAAKSYDQALKAAENLYKASTSHSSQEAELSETADLFRRAAYAHAQIGDMQQAIVIAETGRARGLREVLKRDRADLTALKISHPSLYQQYQEASAQQRQLEEDERSRGRMGSDSPDHASETQWLQRAEGNRHALASAIDAIRNCPDYENFLAEPNLADIAAAVQANCPLLYLVTTPNGSLALLTHRQKQNFPIQILPHWLDSLTDKVLKGLVEGPGEALSGWFGSYNQRRTNPAQWLQTLDEVTCQLWDLLMGPVISDLQRLGVGQVVLITTGYLNFLPLHAAWREDRAHFTGRRYALDVVHVTYAPNAWVLRTAQELIHKLTAQSLLTIHDPKPTSKLAIPFAQEEVRAALTYFDQNQVLSMCHNQASREQVLAALPHFDILHFSCHGYVNFDSPLDSGLFMANDEILYLRHFLNLQLQGVRLAILSACETGLPGEDLPDEVVSLPTGLLQAGVAAVISSLWSVSDRSTMLLFSKFYDLWRKDGLPPDQALRQAQIWLRDSTNGELAATGLLFIPPGTPPEVVNQRPYAHPFHWAAFTYTGI